MARLVKRINLARRSQNAPFAKFSSSLHVASLSPFGAERGRSSAATSAWRRRRRRSYENSGFARGTSNHLCICRQEGCDTMVCLLEQALLTPQANAAATWTVHNL
ncbi:uncharacterized protein LOC144112616 isoform X1 [Amblyomma americanum]